MNNKKRFLIWLSLLLTIGCASTNNSQAPTANQPATSSGKIPDSGIVGDVPADSPFARIRLGMTQGQVHEILGQPTDTKSYQTGKAWIPFYFGPDMSRTDEFYKGVGIVTYSGAGIGGVHWKVHRAIYDPSEDGIAN
ncbi:MAG: outer membrane protein assembly factor BamE domain-containing protein [Gammaproteobacteria bacterium]